MNDPINGLYDLKAAADYTNRHPQTLRNHLYNTGKLTGRLLGHTLVFTKDELDTFMARTGPGGRQPAGLASRPIADYRERQREASRLFGKGYSLTRIATTLGYSSRRATVRAIEAGDRLRRQVVK